MITILLQYPYFIVNKFLSIAVMYWFLSFVKKNNYSKKHQPWSWTWIGKGASLLTVGLNPFRQRHDDTL